ncbi:hypothetical protein, partial [Segatella buccae]|uniref:hypothetical protein n=1 Tax=Segatella buccae TaxID=28126 RepID=UPI0022E91E24
LFGFLSQLAYNSGILSKFASAKGAYTCSLFLVSTSKRGLFYLALECHLAQTALQKGLFEVLTRAE